MSVLENFMTFDFQVGLSKNKNRFKIMHFLVFLFA